jgi:chaperonin GroEL
VEDALHATRAAAEEGIVPGGGAALLKARSAVQAVMDSLAGDERIGASIVLRAVEEPIRHIASNSGIDGGVVVDEVGNSEGPIGFNANTGEFVNMFDAGIIDPTKVTRSALENAASIAGLMLTTEAMITNIKEEDEKAPKAEGVVR